MTINELIFKCKNKSNKNNNIPKNDNEIIPENNLIDLELQNVTKKNKIKSIIFLLFLIFLIILNNWYK